MSLPKETIHIIGQMNNMPNLKDEIAQALASDVEYRIREIIQDASKFMKHAKRKRLTTQDINHALLLKNVEPLYGFQDSSTPTPFRKVQNEDLYFVEDLELDIEQCLQAPLPKIPVGPTINAHWLAIQGVQPRIPQNPKILEDENQQSSSSANQPLTSSMADAKQGNGIAAASDLDKVGASAKPLVKHVLSAELQMYYEKVIEAIKSPTSSAAMVKAVLNSLQTDPGLNQLVPYFAQFIAEQVTSHLHDLQRLKHVMEMVKSLLYNSHLQIELYLHQLMPPILTCLVGKKLCRSPRQDHWSLRCLSAQIVAKICRQYSSSYHSLQPRITRTLLHAFLDPQKPRSTHFGAIVGISELGPQVSQLLLLEPMENSNLRAYWSGYLEPQLFMSDNKKYSMERHESLMIYGALLEGASSYFVKLRRFFAQEQYQVNLALEKSEGVNSKKPIIEEDEDEKMDEQQQDGANGLSQQQEPAQALCSSLQERLRALQLPQDINQRYEEMYDIFGESLLPSISYDIYSSPEQAASGPFQSNFAMNVFL